MRGLKIEYDKLPWKPVSDGVRYKPVLVQGCGASMVAFDPGTSHAPHSHDEVQIVFCLEGRMEFYVKDDQSERIETLVPGQVLALEAGVSHGAKALEKSLILTVWNPMTRFTKDSVVV